MLREVALEAAAAFAEELGYHPATIASRVKNGLPAPLVVPDERRVMNAYSQASVAALVGAHPRLWR